MDVLSKYSTFVYFRNVNNQLLQSLLNETYQHDFKTKTSNLKVVK